jgi:hypothetical protein
VDGQSGGGRSGHKAKRRQRQGTCAGYAGGPTQKSYGIWYVPGDLHQQVKQLASEQQRTIVGQVIWMMQDALRREREQSRRAGDAGERGVA